MITHPEAHDHASGACDHALESVITCLGRVIMGSRMSHSVFSGRVRVLSNVLFGVLGPSRHVFDVHFAKISFCFPIKLNLGLTR